MTRNDDRWDDVGRKYENTAYNLAKGGPWSMFFKILAVVIVLGLIGTVVRVVCYPGEQALKIMEKTLDADNVIQNYEWFKQTNQDILSLESKIVNSDAALKRFKEDAGPRKDWKFEDKTEYSRLNTIVLGLQNQRRDVVAKYNARTEMANRELFKTDDLPATHPADFTIPGQ